MCKLIKGKWQGNQASSCFCKHSHTPVYLVTTLSNWPLQYVSILLHANQICWIGLGCCSASRGAWLPSSTTTEQWEASFLPSYLPQGHPGLTSVFATIGHLLCFLCTQLGPWCAVQPCGNAPHMLFICRSNYSPFLLWVVFKKRLFLEMTNPTQNDHWHYVWLLRKTVDQGFNWCSPYCRFVGLLKCWRLCRM